MKIKTLILFALPISLLGILLFTSAATALTQDDVAKYHLSSKDAKALIGYVEKDVKQQCEGRTDSEMSRCIDAKTGPVLKQYANKCIDNKKFDTGCADKVLKDNNDPNQDHSPDSASTTSDPNTNCDNENGCDLIKKYVNPTIRVLSITIGLIVAASLITAGIQYAASSGDPQKTAEAKNRISKTLFALFAYAFMLVFLNFLIPGGVFNR